MLFRCALSVAGAGLAIAQSLSSNCSSALLSVATSSQASCLDLPLLAPLLSSNSNTSVIPTVDSWLTGMCSQGQCSNSTLQTVVTTIMNGCSSDLASIGLGSNDTSSAVKTVQTFYPTVRQVVCLKDTSANTLCATEVLTGIQSANTILSLDNIASLITQAMSGSNITIPQNVTCSNCSKAAYTIVTENFPSLLSEDKATLQSECGTSFTDGQVPSNIQETAANKSASGAVSLSASSFNSGVTMLVAVSSALAFLA